MRRRLLVAALTGVLAVGGGAAGALALRAPGSPAPAEATHAHTATVTRGDLAQTTTVPGTVGHGTATPVTGHGTGTVTWLPAVGDVVDRGGQLYRVDDRPVVLLIGDLPLYRPLSQAPGPDGKRLRGADVDLVAANLAALGFWDGPTSDVAFTRRLERAVGRWQKAVGRPETGAIDPADVVVAPAAVRVDAVTAHLGDAVGTPLLTTTGEGKVVVLDVPVGVAPAMASGQEVEVALGEGTRVTAQVATIGAPAAGGASEGGPTGVPVTLVPPTGFDAPPGPVTATVVTASRPGVLHVPVAALLALAGGGYAVEAPDGTLTPVTIGMVADGEVEVTGVTEGAQVVVP